MRSHLTSSIYYYHIACSHLACLCLLSNLPLLPAAELTDPGSQQCLTAPCNYAGECRARSGVCGDTTVHCNEESTWVPACGGSAGLDKPAPAPVMPPQPTPANAAAEYDAAAAEVPTQYTQQASSSSSGEDTSAPPTTKWELWISNKQDEDASNQEEEEEEAKKGVSGLTTGKEGEEGEYVPSNNTADTDWFNPEIFGDRYDNQTEDKSMLDKITFWDNSAMRASKTEAGLLLSILVAWAVLI